MNQRLAITFILLSVVMDSMGIGLIMPVMPDLIREIEGTDIGSAAVWGGILATIFAVMQFLFGPTIGSLSDRFGRRPVLLLSLVVMAFDYVLMAVAGTMWLLIIGRVIGGITAATQSTAAAYMADISKPEEKAANFGLFRGAAIWLVAGDDRAVTGHFWGWDCGRARPADEADPEQDRGTQRGHFGAIDRYLGLCVAGFCDKRMGRTCADPVDGFGQYRGARVARDHVTHRR